MEQNSQLIAVPVDTGIDNTLSDKGEPVGARRMLNMVFGAERDVTSRPGFTITTEADIAPGVILPSFDDAVTRGTHRLPLNVETALMVGGTGGRTLMTSADVYSTETLVASLIRPESTSNTETAGVDAYVLLHVITDSQVVATKAITSLGNVSAIQVTASNAGGGWLLSWVDRDNNDLKLARITYASLAVTVGSTVTAFSALPTDWYFKPYAIELDASGYWTVFAWDGGSPVLKWAKYNSAMSIVSDAATAHTSASSVYDIESCAADGLFWLVTGHSTASRVGVYQIDAATMSFSKAAFVPKGSFGRAIIVPGRSTGTANVAYEEYGSSNNGVCVFHVAAGLSLQPTSAASIDVLNGVWLADAGSYYYDNGSDLSGEARVGCVGLAPQQSVYAGQRAHVLCAFRESLSGGVTVELSAVALLAGGDAGAYEPNPVAGVDSNIGKVARLPRWIRTDAYNITLPVPVVVRTTQDPTIPQASGLDIYDRSARLTRVTSRSWQHRGRAQLGRDIYLGGTIPTVWDGRDLSPAGFLSYHGRLEVAQGAHASALPDGTYNYAVRSTYQNLNGTLFDSPPQYFDYFAVASVTTAAGSTPEVTLRPGTVWMQSYWADSEDRFRTDVFRTANPVEDGDDTMRLAWSVTHSSLGAAEVVADIVAADRVERGELLPDQLNGALTGDLLPPLAHLCAHRSRLFGVDAYDPSTIWFTTEYVPPTAPRWSAVLKLSITNSGGDVRAVASLGDKLVAFQANQITVVSGEGPDAAGNGPFTTPESLRGVGVKAEHQGSVVEVPTGVMFVHDTGIYHLGMDLALSHVGAKLTGRGATRSLPPIVRGAYLPGLSQVWFLTDGTASAVLGSVDIIVWDVLAQRWTTFSSGYGPFHDVVEAQGNVFLLAADGRQLTVSPNSGAWTDEDVTDSTDIPFDIELELPKLHAGHAQQIRLRKVHVTGSQDEAALPVLVEVDVTTINESRGDSESTDHTYSTSLEAFGEGFQIPVRAVTQRCTEAGVTLRLVPDGVTPEAGVTLSGVKYEVSTFSGTGKTAVSKKPTVT